MNYNYKSHSQNNLKNLDCDYNKDHMSFSDFLNTREVESQKTDCPHKNPEKCLEDILCYQAWMCGCEAKLFCNATSRLSYELYNARNLCEVKDVIDTINSLYLASASKENALAKVINAYCPRPYRSYDDCCCDCDPCCK